MEPLCTGDAVWIDTTTAYRLIAADGAELAVADLRLVVPPVAGAEPLDRPRVRPSPLAASASSCGRARSEWSASERCSPRATAD